MSDIADAAGVTRQLLYFHFEGRTHLFLELAKTIDEGARTEERQRRIDDAPDAVAALSEAVALQGLIKPEIHGVVTAVDRLRPSDPDAAAAWDDREGDRYARCLELAERIGAEHNLAEGWKTTDAARVIWSLTSQHSWQDLVHEGHWSNDQWVDRTSRLLRDSLIKTPESGSHL